MRTVLAEETLKTGERLTIECVLAPDPTRESQIRPFLGHKPPNYLAHIESSLAGQCDDLETRFYIGLIDDAMVGNIMTVEANGVGIFGHVNTRQDQRRKGICDAIMQIQMEDFRQRNGRVLLLGTGYQSPAYRIYETHGFRDWPVGHPGLMRYDAKPQAEFEEWWFAPSRSAPVPARWKHWPLVALLAAVPFPAYLRSLTLPLWGVGLLEGPYCKFLAAYSNRAEASACVQESETGAVTAFATCVPDARWPGIHLLDLFAHPNVSSEELAALLQSLSLPSVGVQAYASPHDALKLAVLERMGFQRAAILPHQCREEEDWHDIWVYAR